MRPRVISWACHWRQSAPDGSPAQRAQMAPRHPGTSAIWSTLGAAASIWSSSDAAAALLPTMLPPPPSAPVGRQGTAAVWDNITRSRSYSSLNLTSTDPLVQQQQLWPALYDKIQISLLILRRGALSTLFSCPIISNAYPLPEKNTCDLIEPL